MTRTSAKVAAGPATLAADSRTGRAAARSAVVCLIEEDGATRKALRAVLEGAGYRVLEAVDGGSGHALLRSHLEPLVVLLDYRPPELGGGHLLDTIAQDATLCGRHGFILMTANPYRLQQNGATSIQAMGAAIVEKPFDIEHLLDAVADAAQRLTP